MHCAHNLSREALVLHSNVLHYQQDNIELADSVLLMLGKSAEKRFKLLQCAEFESARLYIQQQAPTCQGMKRPNHPRKWKEYNGWLRQDHTDMEIMAFIRAVLAELPVNKKARINSLPPGIHCAIKIAKKSESFFCICKTVVGVERCVMLAFGLHPIKDLALQVRESDSRILIRLYLHTTKSFSRYVHLL